VLKSIKQKKYSPTFISKISAVLIASASTHRETKRLEYNKNEIVFFNILIVIKNIKKDA
tara:strand:- start:6762 stop:6938 length:177 start_codon:yes stop_codon:yes gene_type:complete